MILDVKFRDKKKCSVLNYKNRSRNRYIRKIAGAGGGAFSPSLQQDTDI